MMATRKKFLIILMVSIFYSVLIYSQSQVPEMISYTGTLTDKTGNLIEGPKTINFKLYNSFTGGTLLWSETQTIELRFGTFNAVLGSPANPLPSDIGSKTVYLQVEMKDGDTWTAMVPRIRVSGSVFTITSKAGMTNRCPDDMVWTGSFCIEKTKRGYGSFSMAIKACSDVGRRLCYLNEMAEAYLEKSALGLTDFYTGYLNNDYEFAGDKGDSAKGMIANAVAEQVWPFKLIGYAANRFQSAFVGKNWIPAEAPHCVPGYFEDPEWCITFAYYRCCMN